MASPTATAQPKAPKNVAQAIIRTDSPAPSSIVTQENGSTDSFDHTILKELQKNIRNISKKIANSQKAESIVAQNAGKSLDDLVAARIINKDQKEQIMKKPGQVAQRAQWEEQQAQLIKLSSELRQEALADKTKLREELLQASHQQKEEAVQEAEAKAADEKRVAVHDTLLAVAQFLRLAAARRAEEADQNLDENRALEGVLLQVYSGDEAAVSTMLKLVDGSEETTVSTQGEPLHTTYAQVKAAAQAYRSPYDAAEEVEAEVEAEAEAEAEPEAGPEATASGAAAVTETVAIETAVEAETTAPAVSTETSVAEETEVAVVPAANTEQAPASPEETSASQDWVKIKHEDAEATPVIETAEPAAEPPTNKPWGKNNNKPRSSPKPSAAAHHKKAWAEDTPAGAESGDGFHQVQRKSSGAHQRNDSYRGRGRGRGEWRGGRGSFRGGNGGGRGGRGSGGPHHYQQQGQRQVVARDE
ncbi:hypothetical protein CFIMG_001555RA [Ceratocystis fimbriata CBS 114723]|uniref:YAG7-like dimerisation domain-containing protein n=1 Tax=Ceratocystis fimbriata CBS 114723 TaxID=1035309 RepID=A0A2C5X698_9PEZI|nr:hypothetical protein CFIMG_001555RA [Ceratocystis fimbriata CBS 114723]